MAPTNAVTQTPSGPFVVGAGGKERLVGRYASPPLPAVRRHDSVKASRPGCNSARGGLRCTRRAPADDCDGGPPPAGPASPPDTTQVHGARVSGARGETHLPAPLPSLYWHMQ
ncbi:hypothetical protein GCM10010360_53340 [Streptomyces nogalater]